jgi:hypothetical protein
MADWWGRRVPIAVGGILMVLGGMIGTFANGYGSKYKLMIRSVSLDTSPMLTSFQCMSQVDSCLVSATLWPKWPPPFYLLNFAIPNIEAELLPSTTVSGIWVHFVRKFVYENG